jgi:hypothetical protein
VFDCTATGHLFRLGVLNVAYYFSSVTVSDWHKWISSMTVNCSELSFKIIQMNNFLLTKFKVPIGHCLHSETRTYIKLNVSGS